MIDLFNEEDQREFAQGPVPSGSKVMVRITIEQPKYPAPEDPFISITKNGYRQLWAKCEVSGGMYEGVKWYENIWLPTGLQRVPLGSGHTQACNMGGARIKAIVQAARGISPKDQSEKARRALSLASWLDLSGMEFPARLGIAKEPYEGRDGRIYWNNIIAAVITPDKDEYAAIRSGQEVITDGPVTGDSSRQSHQQQSGGGYGYSEPPDYLNSPDDGLSDVPF